MTATYAKLKDGNWGIRVKADSPPSGAVTVAKRDGSTKVETVSRVLWSGDGVHLCAIAQSERRGKGNVCAECGKGGSLVSDLEDGLLKHYRCCDIPPNGY